MSKYEEALGRAKMFKGQHPTRSESDLIDAIFPELTQSEDEKIRKFFTELATDACGGPGQEYYEELGLNYDKVITWLEKRKELPFMKDVRLGYPGLYFYDGERMHFQGYPAMEEKQKEPIPIPDKFSGLKSLMLQYLQSAANRKDDTEIESDTDLWGRKILDYVWKYDEKRKEQKPIFKKGDKVIWQDEEFNILDVNEDSYTVGGYILPFYRQNELSLVEQKPAEWSERDECALKTAKSPTRKEFIDENEKMRNITIRHLSGYIYPNSLYGKEAKECIDWLKSLRPQYHGDVTMTEAYKMGLEAGKASSWKPSEEQMGALSCVTAMEWDSHGEELRSLYRDLKKLM